MTALFLLAIFSNAFLLSVECSLEHIWQKSNVALHSHHDSHAHQHKHDAKEQSSNKKDDCCTDFTTAFFEALHAVPVASDFNITSPSFKITTVLWPGVISLQTERVYKKSQSGKDPPPLIHSGVAIRILRESFQI